MGVAKEQYQEMVECISAQMTETSEELTKKTLELLERNMEVVELKTQIRKQNAMLIECHDWIREHCDIERNNIFDWETLDARIMATQRNIRIA